MTSSRPKDVSTPPLRHTADAAAPPSRDMALLALAREANLLALSAAAPVSVPAGGAGTRASAMIALAAETERVARRIERAIEAMRATDCPGGPSEDQVAAATAALAAARAIAAHSQSAVEGTRVAAEGFASAAASLAIGPRQADQASVVRPAARAN